MSLHPSAKGAFPLKKWLTNFLAASRLIFKFYLSIFLSSKIAPLLLLDKQLKLYALCKSLTCLHATPTENKERGVVFRRLLSTTESNIELYKGIHLTL